MQLGVGEALVSMLDAKGSPSMVENADRAAGRKGWSHHEERKATILQSQLQGEYDALDRPRIRL